MSNKRKYGRWGRRRRREETKKGEIDKRSLRDVRRGREVKR